MASWWLVSPSRGGRLSDLRIGGREGVHYFVRPGQHVQHPQQPRGIGRTQQRLCPADVFAVAADDDLQPAPREPWAVIWSDANVGGAIEGLRHLKNLPAPVTKTALPRRAPGTSIGRERTTVAFGSTSDRGGGSPAAQAVAGARNPRRRDARAPSARKPATGAELPSHGHAGPDSTTARAWSSHRCRSSTRSWSGGSLEFRPGTLRNANCSEDGSPPHRFRLLEPRPVGHTSAQSHALTVTVVHQMSLRLSHESIACSLIASISGARGPSTSHRRRPAAHLGRHRVRAYHHRVRRCHPSAADAWGDARRDWSSRAPQRQAGLGKERGTQVLRGILTDCPRSRDRDRRHAAQRHRRDRRCRPARLPRRLAGRRARHAVRPKASACRSSRLARAGAPSRTRSAARPRAWPSDTLTGGRVRRLARPAAPTTASAGPGRSPRPPSSGTGSAPPPPAAVAAVAWRTHRPPPAVAGSVVNRCGGGWSAVADAPSAPARARTCRRAATFRWPRRAWSAGRAGPQSHSVTRLAVPPVKS